MTVRLKRPDLVMEDVRVRPQASDDGHNLFWHREPSRAARPSGVVIAAVGGFASRESYFVEKGGVFVQKKTLDHGDWTASTFGRLK